MLSCDSLDVPKHWRPEVEECIKDNCLTDSARSEIIRVNCLLVRGNLYDLTVSIRLGSLY